MSNIQTALDACVTATLDYLPSRILSSNGQVWLTFAENGSTQLAVVSEDETQCGFFDFDPFGNNNGIVTVCQGGEEYEVTSDYEHTRYIACEGGWAIDEGNTPNY